MERFIVTIVLSEGQGRPQLLIPIDADKPASALLSEVIQRSARSLNIAPHGHITLRLGAEDGPFIDADDCLRDIVPDSTTTTLFATSVGFTQPRTSGNLDNVPETSEGGVVPNSDGESSEQQEINPDELIMFCVDCSTSMNEPSDFEALEAGIIVPDPHPRYDSSYDDTSSGDSPASDKEVADFDDTDENMSSVSIQGDDTGTRLDALPGLSFDQIKGEKGILLMARHHADRCRPHFQTRILQGHVGDCSEHKYAK